MVLWAVAGVALLIAIAALAKARRTGRKLESLTQSYWELRYDYTRLRSVVSRLDPGESSTSPGPGPPDRRSLGEGGDDQPPAASQVTFVPLSSMKKKNG